MKFVENPILHLKAEALNVVDLTEAINLLRRYKNAAKGTKFTDDRILWDEILNGIDLLCPDSNYLPESRWIEVWVNTLNSESLAAAIGLLKSRLTRARRFQKTGPIEPTILINSQRKIRFRKEKRILVIKAARRLAEEFEDSLSGLKEIKLFCEAINEIEAWEDQVERCRHIPYNKRLLYMKQLRIIVDGIMNS